MRIVEKATGNDFNLGTGVVPVTLPNGGSANCTQISLTTFSLAGADGSRVTQTWDPAAVSSGLTVTTTVTVPGAALGDPVIPTFSLDLQGLVLTAYVSSANTVTVVLQNPNVGSIDLGSGTLAVLVFRVK